VSIDLWASLAPADAVIPAQVAYFDVAAVEKLGVGWLPWSVPSLGSDSCRIAAWALPRDAPHLAAAPGEVAWPFHRELRRSDWGFALWGQCAVGSFVGAILRCGAENSCGAVLRTP